MIKKNHCPYAIIKLDKKQDKRSFSCGVETLDHYLLTQANQDIKKNVSVTYVLTHRDSDLVLGYYTLSSFSILSGELPDDVIKKIPKYPALPAILLGRLAVDIQYQKKKIATLLLMDALKRSVFIRDQIGAIAVVVQAKNKKAAEFYKHHDFIAFSNHKLKLFLLLDTIKTLKF